MAVVQSVVREDQDLVLVIGPVPPPFTGTEMMTRVLLQSGLKDCFRMKHLNTSRQRPVHTKGRFDAANIAWGFLHLARLAWMLVRHRPDTVVLPYAQNRAAGLRDGLFVLLSSAAGSHIVAVFHNSTFGVFFARCGPAWRRFLLLSLRRIDRVVVLAEFLESQFDDLVDRRRISVCYNGIDPGPFRLARTGVHRGRGDIQFLFVGHLSRAKGALDVLRAFREVARMVPGPRLVMIGAPIPIERNVTVDIESDETWNGLFAKVSNEFSGRVDALGVVSGEEKERLFARSDVFILPSHSEAFPVSVLEAMAAGLPIITTPVGALPEVLQSERNALFVEPGAGNQIRDAMLRLVQDAALRERMGRQNERLLAERFSLRHFEGRMRIIIDEAMGDAVPADG